MAGYLPKPPFTAVINKSHPLSDKVVLACPITEKGGSVSSEVQDVSGNGFSGVPASAQTYVGSPWGSALDSSDSVGFGNDERFSFGDGTTDVPFSIHCLVKIDTLGNYFVMSKDGSPAREHFLYLNTSNILVSLYSDGSTTVRIGRRVDAVLSADVWYNIVWSYNGNGSSTGIKIYLNGVRVDTTDYESNSADYTATINKAVGFTLNSRTSGFLLDGKIANAVIWNGRELTASEVAFLHHDPFCIYRASSRLSKWISSTLVSATNLLSYYYKTLLTDR